MGGKLGNFKMSGHFQWLSLVVGGELQVATLPRIQHEPQEGMCCGDFITGVQ